MPIAPRHAGQESHPPGSWSAGRVGAASSCDAGTPSSAAHREQHPAASAPRNAPRSHARPTSAIAWQQHRGDQTPTSNARMIRTSDPCIDDGIVATRAIRRRSVPSRRSPARRSPAIAGALAVIAVARSQHGSSRRLSGCAPVPRGSQRRRARPQVPRRSHRLRARPQVPRRSHRRRARAGASTLASTSCAPASAATLASPSCAQRARRRAIGSTAPSRAPASDRLATDRRGAGATHNERGRDRLSEGTGSSSGGSSSPGGSSSRSPPSHCGTPVSRSAGVGP